MKKLFLVAVAVIMTAFSARAQVKIESPHPDLDIKITRCACTSGILIIDMTFTNYGVDETIVAYGTYTGSSYRDVVAFDDEGNIYNRDNAEISIGLPSQGHDKRGLGNKIPLPQDVPIKIRCQVAEVNSNATKLALIKFPIESKGAMKLNSNKPIIIRNLEWVK